MQLKSESDKKEKELFEENKAANLRMQSKHEEFTKLSVNFEHFRGESQNLKAERDKLLQDIEKMSQSEAALPKEFQVQSEELQARKVKCGCVYFLQEPNLLLFISGQEGQDVLSGVHHRPGKGWQFRTAGIWLCLLLALSFTD